MGSFLGSGRCEYYGQTASCSYFKVGQSFFPSEKNC